MNSYAIATHSPINGLDLAIYDDCEDSADALICYIEDRGWSDEEMPDVGGLREEDALSTIANWLWETQEIQSAVEKL